MFFKLVGYLKKDDVEDANALRCFKETLTQLASFIHEGDTKAFTALLTEQPFTYQQVEAAITALLAVRSRLTKARFELDGITLGGEELSSEPIDPALRDDYPRLAELILQGIDWLGKLLLAFRNHDEALQFGLGGKSVEAVWCKHV